jgi:hypothetical protein
MKYVIDASAVIDFLEARASVASWLPTVVPRDVGLPAAVLARLVERAHGEPERRKLDLLAVLSEMRRPRSCVPQRS